MEWQNAVFSFLGISLLPIRAEVTSQHFQGYFSGNDFGGSVAQVQYFQTRFPVHPARDAG
jgi:hypothetical protein